MTATATVTTPIPLRLARTTTPLVCATIPKRASFLAGLAETTTRSWQRYLVVGDLSRIFSVAAPPRRGADSPHQQPPAGDGRQTGDS